MRKYVFFTAVSIFAASAAIAHPGHDHAATSSGLLHALFALSIVGTAGLGIYFASRKSAKQEDNQ